MLNIELNGTVPKHVERIKPELNTDEFGNITWVPSLLDYDASLFYRGKTVTNEEFNTLFLRNVYQGNYITDSLTELFQKHLGTAIRRKFTTDFNLIPSYIKTFSTADWGEVHADGYYYISIPASEHGIHPDEYSDTALDRMNMDTEMYLLNKQDGTFFEVTQVETDTENTVTIYTDDNTLSGFVVIRTNDKAYALASATIDASQISGLSAVALSAKYTDLIDRAGPTGPDTRIAQNATDITKIINGTFTVSKAINAVSATEALSLLGSGTIANIPITNIFETGSSYVKNATTANNYNETVGTIKDKFSLIEASITSKDNAILNELRSNYYKKTDTVTTIAAASQTQRGGAKMYVANGNLYIETT